MAGLVESVALVMGGGGTTIIAQAVGGWWKSRADRKTAELSNDLKLEEHRDSLTFELLEAARAELTEMRVEVQRLRPMEAHLIHFEQALEHIERLLGADNEQARMMAERNARAFLNRMRRLADARGTIANEAQRIDSAVSMAERADQKR